MDDAITNSGLVFTIGLTGHRDIHPDAVADVRTSLRKELEALKSRFDTLSVELVTGLAEGADMLATEIALETGMPVRRVITAPALALKHLSARERNVLSDSNVAKRLAPPPAHCAFFQPAMDALTAPTLPWQRHSGP